jgi:hypothetical protein
MPRTKRKPGNNRPLKYAKMFPMMMSPYEEILIEYLRRNVLIRASAAEVIRWALPQALKSDPRFDADEFSKFCANSVTNLNAGEKRHVQQQLNRLFEELNLPAFESAADDFGDLPQPDQAESSAKDFDI